MSERNDERDMLEGLPADLVAILRDPSVMVPQDAAVFELVAKWLDSQSDAASALSAEEWRRALTVTCRRMLRAQHEAQHQAGIVADVRQILSEWSLGRRSDPERALREIAKRVGFYLATETTP